MSDLKRNHRCCFTGHRPEKLKYSKEEVIKRLDAAIDNAISDGYNVFISGMARGVDMWAAELVLEKKNENPDLKLMCAVPFEGFEKKWEYSETEGYRRILENADYVKFVCEHYSKMCFHIRNCFMVDNSSRIIAAYNGENGGTKNTVSYAKTTGVEIVNILEN